jgi:hypothetical protein
VFQIYSIGSLLCSVVDPSQRCFDPVKLHIYCCHILGNDTWSEIGGNPRDEENQDSDRRPSEVV